MLGLLLSALALVPDCTPTPNSTGFPALLEHDGRMQFSCVQLPPLVAAGLTAGPVAWSIPFGDGVSCISPMVGWFRTAPQLADSQGQITYNMGYHQGFVSIPPGSTLHVQAWYRDPGFGSFGFNLSSRVTIEL